MIEDRILPSQELLDHINNLTLVSHGNRLDNLDSIYGLRSIDTYILDNPLFDDIRKYFEKTALHLLKNIMQKKVKEARILQSWLTVKKPGQSHIRHRHSNCAISGVWWYEYDKQNPPMPLYMHQHDLSPQDAFSLRPIYADWHYQPQDAGFFLLFPSYTYHSVPMNTSAKDRKSIAFNIGVSESIGYDVSGNEMKFERLI